MKVTSVHWGRPCAGGPWLAVGDAGVSAGRSAAFFLVASEAEGQREEGRLQHSAVTHHRDGCSSGCSFSIPLSPALGAGQEEHPNSRRRAQTEWKGLADNPLSSPGKQALPLGDGQAVRLAGSRLLQIVVDLDRQVQCSTTY